MEKIQELTDRLYREGVEKGNAEGQRLVEQAREEAARLLAEARKEAEEIVAGARKEARELDDHTKSELRLYAGQALNALKSEIVNVVSDKLVKDTVKVAHDGLVESTPDRSALFAVQTPQVFQKDLIRTALLKALEAGAELTDDCSAVERLGIGVALTEGDYCNLKVTTPEDLAAAEALLAWREEV